MINNDSQDQATIPNFQPFADRTKPPIFLFILILVVVALVSYGGVYLWRQKDPKKTQDFTADSTKIINSPNTTAELLSDGVPSESLNSNAKLIIKNNVLEIDDGKIVMPVLKMVISRHFDDEYRLYMAINASFTDFLCEDVVYLQRGNGVLLKVYSGDCDGMVSVSDVGFFSNESDLFFIKMGSGGESLIITYDFSGYEIKFTDEKKILADWSIRSIEKFGWEPEYKSHIATFYLSKDFGPDLKYANVKVDMDKLKVIPETFKETGSTQCISL